MTGQSVTDSVNELMDYVDDIEELVDEEEASEEGTEEEPEEGLETEESEGDSEEEPEEPLEEVEEKLIEITIGDEEYEVNLEELKSGYIRNEELVKAKEQLEEQVSAKEYELLADREKLVEQYNQLLLEDNANLQQFQNIDWEKFRQQNPEAYREWRIKYVEAQEAHQSRVQRRDQIASLHKKQEEARHQAYVSKQQRLALELIPELEEPNFVDELVAYGKTIGFTREEIFGIVEAKQLYVLKQAMDNSNAKARRAEANKKIEKVVPQVVKPRTTTTKADTDKTKSSALRSKLNSTHSMKDAANVLLDFI